MSDLLQQVKDGTQGELTPEEAYSLKVESRYTSLKVDKEAKQRLRDEECPPQPMPVARTLEDRLQNKTQPVPQRIEGLMYYGHRVLLVAQYKAGKTTLVVNLIRSLLDHRPFLNKYRVRAITDITLIDAEMATENTNQLDEWYERAGIKRQSALKIVALRGAASSFNLLDPIVRSKWADSLRGTKLLVLDCLRPILDAIGLDENHEAGRFYTAFDELLKEAGIAEAIVVTHMGHQNERARGDSRNLDWPDVTWNLVRADENPASKRFFKAFGRDVDHPEIALEYDAKTVQLSVGTGNRTDDKASSILSDLLSFVESCATPPNQTEIRAAMKQAGISDRVTRSAIRIATKNGQLLEKAGKKKNSVVYSVAPPAPPLPDDSV